MTASIPRVQGAINGLTDAILICYGRYQIFE